MVWVLGIWLKKKILWFKRIVYIRIGCVLMLINFCVGRKWIYFILKRRNIRFFFSGKVVVYFNGISRVFKVGINLEMICIRNG